MVWKVRLLKESQHSSKGRHKSSQATCISVRHTWIFPRKKAVFCRVLSWWKIARLQEAKKAQLATKFQVDSLKLKQGTSMCVHVYIKACIKYSADQKWNIIDLTEEDIHILLGQRKVKIRENIPSCLLFKKISPHKPHQLMSQHMLVMPRQKILCITCR